MRTFLDDVADDLADDLGQLFWDQSCVNDVENMTGPCTLCYCYARLVIMIIMAFAFLILLGIFCGPMLILTAIHFMHIRPRLNKEFRETGIVVTGQVTSHKRNIIRSHNAIESGEIRHEVTVKYSVCNTGNDKDVRHDYETGNGHNVYSFTDMRCPESIALELTEDNMIVEVMILPGIPESGRLKASVQSQESCVYVVLRFFKLVAAGYLLVCLDGVLWSAFTHDKEFNLWTWLAMLLTLAIAIGMMSKRYSRQAIVLNAQPLIHHDEVELEQKCAVAGVPVGMEVV